MMISLVFLKKIEVKAVYIDELINSTMTVILEVQLI